MNPLRGGFERQPRAYFEGLTEGWAVQALRTYCDGRTINRGWRFSGAWFDRLSDHSSPDSFTVADIVAVKMLSVEVPANAAIRILETEHDHFSDLLRSMGPDRPIWTVDAVELEPGSPAHTLWQTLHDLQGVGAVIAGKLMAAKRPSLIPIFDQHVQTALNPPAGAFWTSMRASMIDSHEAVAATVSRAGVEISLLRAVDIVVWLHQYGWKYAKEELGEPPGFLT